jgi:hypothetical protein
MRSRRTARVCFRLLVVLALAAGCGPPATLPKTYPVRGKVVYKDGQPMDGGLVEFHSTRDPLVRATAEIGPDGRFTLATPTERRPVPGAPDGDYSVTVLPRMEGDQAKQPMPDPINLARTYTVKPDDTNDLTITLDRPKQRP